MGSSNGRAPAEGVNERAEGRAKDRSAEDAGAPENAKCRDGETDARSRGAGAGAGAWKVLLNDTCMAS
jgi:hypothetical protein